MHTRCLLRTAECLQRFVHRGNKSLTPEAHCSMQARVVSMIINAHACISMY